MRPTRFRLIVISLLVAACGGSGSNGAPPSTLASPNGPVVGAASPDNASSGAAGATTSAGGEVKACDLISASEIATATGVAGVAATETDAIKGQFSCGYAGGDTPVAADTVITPASPISPSKTYDGMAAGAETLTGIGDKAIWAAIPGSDAGSLYAMVGDTLFTLSVLTTTPDTPDQRKAITIQLGKLAVSRLS